MAKQKKLERMSKAQATELMASVPDWTLEDDAISQNYKFKDFRGSLAFVERVADIADDLMLRHSDVPRRCQDCS